ncbi:hypothetical protein PG987_009693 [Apiospora arundinis]
MATISAEVVEARIKEYGRLWTIDDLIRVRARDKVQSPILGYPRYQSKPTDYEYFTGKNLDRMVDETCHLLVRDGLKVNSYKTVALFAQSDLSFVVTFFALFRLGCKVLLISIRLGEPACLNLLATAECDTIMYGTTARIKATIADLKKTNASLNFIPMPSRQDYDRPDRPRPEPFFRPIADKEAEHVQVSLIAHSSGSTGLPKPLFLSHRSIINSIPTGTGLRAFNALPWYHIHGLFTSLMAMWMRQPAHMFNADLPLTAENLILALKEARPEICHCVPYTLKLMAEREDGIEVLRKCKYVTSAGARTPDELGDKLVKAGVKLGVIYGMTEVGHVGDSIYREPGDDSWDYVRPYPSLRPHMMFKLRGGGRHVGGGGNDVYEAVYLKSHPALKMSNSDNPPGSFHSRDLWTPHPILPDAWKYVARDDDTVTLLSGEKILPLGIEGAIRESPFVRDALVVGNDRLTPGVLVFRAATGPDGGQPAWDEFARITRDMVVPVPADVSYPATDKNNIIRGAAYAQFQDYIDAMYAEIPLQQQTNGANISHKKKKLGVEELERVIRSLLRDHADIDVPDAHTDFFAAGLDSLRAAQIRRLLLQSVDLGGCSLPTNAVYDAGNVAELARRLYAMSMGEATVTNGHITTQSQHTPTNGRSDSSDLRLMQQMIDEYGSFERRKPGILPQPEKETVILTGATGALGAHILHQLLQDPQVSKIYCLVRSSSPIWNAKEAIPRLVQSAAQVGALPRLRERQGGRCEWMPVDTAARAILELATHMKGVSSPSPPPYRSPSSSTSSSFFLSVFRSILGWGPAKNGPLKSKMPILPSYSYPQQSIGANMEDTSVIRLEKVVTGVDSGENDRHTSNNDKSAATLTASALFYNLVAPHHFSWNDDFLPAVRASGLLCFDEVDLPEWLARLRTRAAELGAEAEARLPAIQLVDYYEATYMEGQDSGAKEGNSSLVWDVGKACAHSEAARTCPQVVEAGLVPKMVRNWLAADDGEDYVRKG